jgi:hypothetical protein
MHTILRSPTPVMDSFWNERPFGIPKDIEQRLRGWGRGMLEG